MEKNWGDTPSATLRNNGFDISSDKIKRYQKYMYIISINIFSMHEIIMY